MTAFRAVLYSSRRRVQTVAVFTLTLLFLLINSAEKSQAYTLQGSWMNQVNWLYVGYAPRMNDPARVSVTISKQGFTARVHMQLNDEDIIDYPKYLIRRKNQIEAKIKKIIDDPYQLIVFTRKETRQAYLNHINEIEVMLNLLKQKNAEKSEYYSLGLELLHQHFPENITRWPDTGYPYLEMDFVYPITINEEGLTKPLKDVHPQARPTLESPDSFYRVQSFDERRSDHFFYKDVNGAQTREGIKDYLFDGFPAFWIDLSGKGTGLHGPIRYSAAIDQKSWASYMASHQIPPDEDKKHVLGKLDGHHLRAKWNQPPFNYIPGLDADIETRYRFEVVRTADSGGCFRAEPMEIRHLLPAEPSKLKQVNWRVLDYHDVLPNGQYVDVNYYVTNPYQGPIHRMQWYRTHFVPYELRQAVRNSNKKIEQENLDQIVKSHLPEIHVFPYLNPNVLEFSYYRDQRKPEERRINPHPIPIIENARSTMGYFNRAGEK